MRASEFIKEVVNPKIFNDIINSLPTFGTKPVRIGDFMFDARTFIGTVGNSDAQGLQIRAYDPKLPKGSGSIGSADFVVHSDKKDKWLESADTEVKDEYHGKGVAYLMYAYAKSLGNDIRPSPYQSVAGSAMWRKWDSDAQHLFKEVSNLMRAKEFIIEYDRNKTTQMMGKNLANAFALGADKRQFQYYNTTFLTPEGQPDLQKIVDYVLTNLEEADPTPNKMYTPWLAREYGKQTLKRLEDAHVLTPLIADYDKYKKRNDFPRDAKDIMRLSYSQFYTVMKNYEPPPEPIKDKGVSKQVFASDEVRIIVPEDEQAACYYGQGTTWCTAATKGTNYFDRYSRSGPLYIMLPNKPTYVGEKYQVHFPTDQFMDEKDDAIDFAKLLTDRFPSTIEFFKKVEPSINDWIIFCDPKLLVSIGDQIRSLTMDRVWEIINDWEVDDNYFREWQLETAMKEGIINNEMTDDEIWDIIHENPKLNDYLEFNPEANEYFNDVQKAVNLSPREMVEIAENIMAYEDPEPLTYMNLEEVYSKSIWDYFRRNNDMQIADFVHNKLDVTRDGNVKYRR